MSVHDPRLTHMVCIPLLLSRPLSQPVPYALHCPLEDDADSISLARSISKDSLASNILSMTPKHMPGAQLPQNRLSVQSLLSHMRIEDEEEEIEEEELVAVIHPSALPRCRLGSDMEQDELEIPSAPSTSRVSNTRCSPRLDVGPDGYYLEPLMPAISKPAKEKSISLNKEEESGESRCKATAAARKAAISAPRRAPAAELNKSTFTPIPVAESVRRSLRPPTEGSSGTAQPEKKQSSGFFLHSSAEAETPSTALEMGQDSDSDIADLEEDNEEDEQMALTKEVLRRGKGVFLEEGEGREFGEGESAKLREDLKVSERDDKEGGSGGSSPCLSTASWASSCSASCSTSVKMTSFAERKLLKLGLRDGFSSTSSSQKTTPDGSEVAPCSPWQVRSDTTLGWLGKEPSSVLGKNLAVSPPVVPSELLQLHMQLEEQRRAIEYQKKKMETLSARQRLKLGKAAFLNIVKKGGGKSETLPLPLKHSTPFSELSDRSHMKTQSCRDDSCLAALKVEARAGQTEGETNRSNKLPQDNGAEPDLNECSHSIDLLNNAISSIQQQMMQLSFQQDQLMKRVASPPQPPVKRAASPPQSPVKRAASPPQPPVKRAASPPQPPVKRAASPPQPPVKQAASPPQPPVKQAASPLQSPVKRAAPSPEPPMKCAVSPPERVESSASTTTHSTSPPSDSRSFAVHFVDITGGPAASARRPPKLSSGKRSKTSELKQSREDSKMAAVKSHSQSLEGGDGSGRFQERSIVESSRPETSVQRNSTFRVGGDPEQRDGEGAESLSGNALTSQAAEHEENTRREAVGGEENTRVQVDQSELTDPLAADCTADGEQKNVIGYFFKVKRVSNFWNIKECRPGSLNHSFHRWPPLHVSPRTRRRQRRKQRMKWRSAATPSSSSSSAKRKRRDYASSIKRWRVR